MTKKINSFDFLRGLGVFFVLMLHTAFYFYADIYDVDMENPSLIITLIGFLLMFAGLFAMVSGASYTIQFLRTDTNQQRGKLKHMAKSGLLLLLVAYLYFLITGPGIIHFETRSMDESLLVSFINQGSFQPLTLERIFYVDSLVMLSLNILLLTGLFRLIKKHIFNPKMSMYMLLGATLFMVISYIRIPLYNVYLEALDDKNYIAMLLLNFFVAKNNPILPFFAFALFGVWFALLIYHQPKQLSKQVLPVVAIYLVIGILGYILAPETMLERAIDPTWYFIMVIQIGLFLGMMLMAYQLMDRKTYKGNVVSRFISRFGVAGLTPFFFEQIVSALLFFIINLLVTVEFGIPGALLYGLMLALSWGYFLVLWEKKSYRYGLEWAMTRLNPTLSSKKDKLEAK